MSPLRSLEYSESVVDPAGGVIFHGARQIFTTKKADCTGAMRSDSLGRELSFS